MRSVIFIQLGEKNKLKKIYHLISCTMEGPLTIAVTGAAGQIAYSFLFRLLSSFSPPKQQKINLILLDLPVALNALEGVVMELQDCAFGQLNDVTVTSEVDEAFVNADWVILLGAFPRGPGMSRSDLLEKNCSIFRTQGAAISKFAKLTCRIVVIGNPCNTNTAISIMHCPRIPPSNFYAMTMLDVNRAKGMMRNKVRKVGNEDVVIWGNHSSTMVVDYRGEGGVEENFKKIVQNRGASVIKARGSSSAASAANAIVDTMNAIVTPNTRFCAGVASDGSYGVEKGLVFSFPLVTSPDGTSTSIVQDLNISESLQTEIEATKAELQQELATVTSLFAADSSSKL